MLLLQRRNPSKGLFAFAAVAVLGMVVRLNTVSCTETKDGFAILSPSASVVPEHVYPYQGFGASLAASVGYVVVAGGE